MTTLENSVEINRTIGASSLKVVDVSKIFGSKDSQVDALQRLSLDIPRGEFVSILGPSGCGKSTLFSLLVGLDESSKGHIEIDDVRVDSLLGRSAYMPQNDALLPWLRVVDNVALGLRGTKTSKRERRNLALTALNRAGLSEFARAYPNQLSGGMRQRVAFLRTLLTTRPILLLDEPFGALDSVTREEMQAWLAEQWEDSGATVVMVTHDVTEAVYLSDRVHVLTSRPGRLSATVPITLPRPRPASIKETPEFADYEVQLRRELRIAMNKTTSD